MLFSGSRAVASCAALAAYSWLGGWRMKEAARAPRGGGGGGSPSADGADAAIGSSPSSSASRCGDRTSGGGWLGAVLRAAVGGAMPNTCDLIESARRSTTDLRFQRQCGSRSSEDMVNVSARFDSAETR